MDIWKYVAVAIFTVCQALPSTFSGMTLQIFGKTTKENG